MITAQDIINRKDEWFNEGSYVGEPWSFVHGSIDEAVLSSLITDAIRTEQDAMKERCAQIADRKVAEVRQGPAGDPDEIATTLLIAMHLEHLASDIRALE